MTYLRRNPYCDLHSTNYEDPAGWGTGCPECELLIYCEDGDCNLSSCHQCHPQFECEYGHPSCYEMESIFLAEQDRLKHGDYYWEEEEDDDDGRYDCWDCRGTGIGYPVDSNCGVCGGSGIKKPKRFSRDPDDDYDPYEGFDDDYGPYGYDPY